MLRVQEKQDCKYPMQTSGYRLVHIPTSLGNSFASVNVKGIKTCFFLRLSPFCNADQ